jgi:hypothetical protein
MYNFEQVTINKNDLDNFDIENLKIEPLLFQTGYLTIVEENPLLRNYTLSFPNLEVKESYLSSLAETYIQSDRLKTSAIFSDLLKFLKNKDTELFKVTINQAFSHIPYSLWQKENEQYYHALVHLIFSLLGVYIFSEVQTDEGGSSNTNKKQSLVRKTQKGRTDSIVMFENEVFIFEFKLNKSADEAFFQIENKGYADKFKDGGMPIYKVGVNFSSEKKEVEEVLLSKEI